MDVISEEGDLLDQIVLQETSQQLKEALTQCLTDQERQVILLRYGLNGGVPMRQREVAQRTGISRSYISRIEKRALEKLKGHLSS